MLRNRAITPRRDQSGDSEAAALGMSRAEVEAPIPGEAPAQRRGVMGPFYWAYSTACWIGGGFRDRVTLVFGNHKGEAAEFLRKQGLQPRRGPEGEEDATRRQRCSALAERVARHGVAAPRIGTLNLDKGRFGKEVAHQPLNHGELSEEDLAAERAAAAARAEKAGGQQQQLGGASDIETGVSEP